MNGQKWYLYATKNGITVLRFARDPNVAAERGAELAEWVGSREAVHVKEAA